MAWCLVVNRFSGCLSLGDIPVFAIEQQTELLMQSGNNAEDLVRGDIATGEARYGNRAGLSDICPVSIDFIEYFQRFLEYMPGLASGLDLYVGPFGRDLVLFAQLAYIINQQLNLGVDVIWGFLRGYSDAEGGSDHQPGGNGYNRRAFGGSDPVDCFDADLLAKWSKMDGASYYSHFLQLPVFLLFRYRHLLVHIHCYRRVPISFKHNLHGVLGFCDEISFPSLAASQASITIHDSTIK